MSRQSTATKSFKDQVVAVVAVAVTLAVAVLSFFLKNPALQVIEDLNMRTKRLKAIYFVTLLSTHNQLSPLKEIFYRKIVA